MHFEKVSAGQFYADNNIYNPYICEDIYNEIKLPTRATQYSAGYDFFAPEDFVIPPNTAIKIVTGVRWVCEEGEKDRVLLIAPRSSTGFKYGVRLMNTIGVIDVDYCNSKNEGDIMIKLFNPSNEAIKVKRGEAFAQGIITTYFTCDGDNVKAKRDGGFGSTTNRE
jgi:dUTP pyrophosphatase